MLHSKQFPLSNDAILHRLSIQGDYFDYFGESRQRRLSNKSFLDIIQYINVNVTWAFTFKLEQYRCDLYHQRKRITDRVDKLCLIYDSNGDIVGYGDIPTHYESLLNIYQTEIERIEEYQHNIKIGLESIPDLQWNRPAKLMAIWEILS